MTAATAPREVVHVVLVAWRRPDRAAECAVLVRRQLPLIAGIAAFECGPSSSPEGLEQGYDWALVVRFVDADARDAYLDHPAHAPVAAHIGAHADRVLVFDLAASAD